MRFARPTTAEAAAATAAGEPGLIRFLSGGTDVMVQLKAGLVEPALIVDLKLIPGMRAIVPEAGGYRIGAAVSGAEMGEHEGLRALWPGVVEGARLIGSTQVQGRATMAGNLCNGSPAADAVPGLMAADALARIMGPAGPRDCPVAEIPAGPGKTTLARGEFVTSIFLPARPDHAGDAYLRFIPRSEMDIGVASAAVSLVLDAQGVVTSARVALGAVAPTVRLVPEAAAALTGSRLEEPALEALAAAARAACSPINDKRGTIEFRTQVAGVLARRAALIAYSRAGGQK
jgi:carbon-monoxide dehydrogenase medium subunit